MDIKAKPGNKILIVEDDEAIRKIMEWQLKNFYRIDIAKNGQEAIELFLQNNYDLILMDISLGSGMNGIEVMKKIQEHEKGKSIPVIAITAYSNFGDKESFLSSGFSNYISKPYGADELLRCIMDGIDENG